MMNESGQEMDAVRAVLDSINEVWLKEDPDRIANDLEAYFDDQVVIVGPSFAPMSHGKAESISSYADFKRQAKVHSCTFTGPAIHVAGDTAVATNGWQIAYTMDNKLCEESGNDVYVFALRSGKWRAVWRAMLPH
jgi:ketosteroid isomerase-like protein